MILILTDPFKPKVGLGIGSPIAAGCAQATVAKVERDKEEELPMEVRRELATKVLRRRWMDDLAVFRRGVLSELAERALAACTEKFVYGEALELERAWGADIFGFVTSTTGGVVGLRPRWSFVHRRIAWEAAQAQSSNPMKGASGVHGGHQYRRKAYDVSIALGHYYRAMDTCNLQEEEVIDLVRRITVELLEAGFDRKAVAKSLTRLEQMSWVRETRLREVLDWMPRQRAAWVMAFDSREALRLENELRKQRGE